MTTRSAPFRRTTLTLAIVAAVALIPLAGTIEAKAANERPAFAELVEQNSSAVVNIRSTIKQTAGVPRGHGSPQAMPGAPFDDFFRRFFEQMPQAPQGRELSLIHI